MSFLGEALSKHSDKVTFCTMWKQEKKDFEEMGFSLPQLSKELLEWYDSLPEFCCMTLEGSCEDFDITGRNDLLAGMGGFRFVPNRKTHIWEDMCKGEWNENWIVIARWNECAALADIGKPGTPIYYAEYGWGEEAPQVLFDSLARFDYFLGVWLSLHEDKYFDFGYHPSLLKRLEKEWRKEFGHEEIKRLEEIMLIEAAEDGFDPEARQKALEEYSQSKQEEDNPSSAQKGVIIVDSIGSNQLEVFSFAKAAIDVNFVEIKEILNNLPVELCDGSMEDVTFVAEGLRELGASVRVEECRE